MGALDGAAAGAAQSESKSLDRPARLNPSQSRSTGRRGSIRVKVARPAGAAQSESKSLDRPARLNPSRIRSTERGRRGLIRVRYRRSTANSRGCSAGAADARAGGVGAGSGRGAGWASEKRGDTGCQLIFYRPESRSPRGYRLLPMPASVLRFDRSIASWVRTLTASVLRFDRSIASWVRTLTASVLRFD